MAAMLAAGSIAPLQCLSYRFPDVAAALRQFARAQHVGKVVMHLPDSGKAANSVGSWVVLGGLGALGHLMTQWMIGQGQHHLVIVGRSGRYIFVFDICLTFFPTQILASMRMCSPSLQSTQCTESDRQHLWLCTYGHATL